MLERVQEKFIKNVSELRGETYEERLAELDMLSLSDRRLYLDLVKTHKIIHGHTNVDRHGLFELVGDRPRRSTRAADCPLNIITKRSRLDVRANFYTNRVAPRWNDLPYEMKMSSKLNAFKNDLKQHLIVSRLV